MRLKLVQVGVFVQLEDATSWKKRAVVGALKCIYFLVVNKLPHTTIIAGLVYRLGHMLGM